jgi:hypothetical protein
MLRRKEGSKMNYGTRKTLKVASAQRNKRFGYAGRRGFLYTRDAMSSLLRTLLAIATITILSACGFTKSKDAAAKVVDTFHGQFNDSKFGEIYAAATPAFKSAASEAEFLKFITAVRTKLGTVKSASATGWNVNTYNGVTTVVLKYDTTFERGSAVESFNFLIAGESAIMQGYNVNSPALITN